jgi:magnesium transporter
MSDIRFFHITQTAKPRPLESLAEAVEALESPGYVWFDLYDPTREQLEALVQPLGIHPLTVEDCLDENQVPKIEDFPGNTFVLFNTFAYEGNRLVIEEVDFTLGRSFLLTVHGHGAEGRRFFDKLDDRIRVELDTVLKGPEFLLHVVLDYAIDKKLAAIEALQDRVDETEEELIRDTGTFDPGNLLHLRRDLLTMRKSLFHEREILVKVCRRDSPYISEKAIYHFRDISDHLTKSFEIVEVYREMVTNAMEMYLSLINNRMARVSNRMNATVRRLTLITTVFMPMTLLAGIGGMSEWSMMTGPENWKLSYPLFLAAMGVMGVVNYFLLKWLESKDPVDFT